MLMGAEVQRVVSALLSLHEVLLLQLSVLCHIPNRCHHNRHACCWLRCWPLQTGLRSWKWCFCWCCHCLLAAHLTDQWNHVEIWELSLAIGSTAASGHFFSLVTLQRSKNATHWSHSNDDITTILSAAAAAASDGVWSMTAAWLVYCGSHRATKDVVGKMGHSYIQVVSFSHEQQKAVAWEVVELTAAQVWEAIHTLASTAGTPPCDLHAQHLPAKNENDVGEEGLRLEAMLFCLDQLLNRQAPSFLVLILCSATLTPLQIHYVGFFLIKSGQTMIHLYSKTINRLVLYRCSSKWSWSRDELVSCWLARS